MVCRKCCKFKNKITLLQYLFGHLLITVQELPFASAVSTVEEITADRGSQIATRDAFVQADADNESAGFFLMFVTWRNQHLSATVATSSLMLIVICSLLVRTLTSDETE